MITVRSLRLLTTSLLLASPLIGAVAPSAAAQENAAVESDLAPGTRVRVTQVEDGGRFRKYTGSLVAITDSSVTIQSGGSTEHRAIPRQAVALMEVSHGTAVLSGLFKGLAIGAGIGAVIGLAAGEDDCSDQMVCFGRGETAVAAAAVFGGAGLVIGGVAGAFTERWRVVADQPRIVIAPVAGRQVAVGATLSF